MATVADVVEQIKEFKDEFKIHQKEGREDILKMYDLMRDTLSEIRDLSGRVATIEYKMKALEENDKQLTSVRVLSTNRSLRNAAIIGVLFVFCTAIFSSIDKIKDKLIRTDRTEKVYIDKNNRSNEDE